jgi:hypothetical protein
MTTICWRRNRTCLGLFVALLWTCAPALVAGDGATGSLAVISENERHSTHLKTRAEIPARVPRSQRGDGARVSGKTDHIAAARSVVDGLATAEVCDNISADFLDRTSADFLGRTRQKAETESWLL